MQTTGHGHCSPSLGVPLFVCPINRLLLWNVSMLPKIPAPLTASALWNTPAHTLTSNPTTELRWNPLFKAHLRDRECRRPRHWAVWCVCLICVLSQSMHHTQQICAVLHSEGKQCIATDNTCTQRCLYCVCMCSFCIQKNFNMTLNYIKYDIVLNIY